MKRFFVALILMMLAFGSVAKAQTGRITNEKQILDSLTTIDPEIVKYFPRWKVCEHDLQIQIYQTFLFMGYQKSEINQQDIEILAAPLERVDIPYDILLITSGSATMNAVQIEYYMGDKIVRFLSGDLVYAGVNRGEFQYDQMGRQTAKRDYCYSEIPTEVPLAASQAEFIMNFLEPTNAKQVITASLFEQSLKIGQTGFWLRSTIGTDQIGYQFWSSGEGKIVLQRPLYVNNDALTRESIPYLINAYMGGAYRVTSGLGNNTIFSWVGERTLNTGPGGKIVAGFDFHMPFNPAFGIGLNVELPLSRIETRSVDRDTYGTYPHNEETVVFVDGDGRAEKAEILGIAPLLRGTGQVTAFYHWWLDRNNPENYFRFDLGLNYNEVRETLLYNYPDMTGLNQIAYISTLGVEGLKTYKPKEFGDWVYAKAEYRNQATFPFGLSLQYSNQIMLGRVWIPLFGSWFYLEGKYATPVRGLRPYEQKNFFMISPLLRLTI